MLETKKYCSRNIFHSLISRLDKTEISELENISKNSYKLKRIKKKKIHWKKHQGIQELWEDYKSCCFTVHTIR